ncbi:MAG: LacI family DNA-binding transcriptional regulator [Fibrobacteres bacterium]|nr:LacI family DNA-binding transcriptional regulator [Fibrobacterota bacterium]
MAAKISIVDIAKLAGVSKTTVSLVLNNKYTMNRISSDTVKRVQDIVREIGFVPNEHARSFRLKRTNSIGLVVGDLSNLFFSRIEDEIERIARNNGYSVLIASTGESEERQKEVISFLTSKNVDGLIIASASSGLTEEDILGCTVPAVFFDRRVISAKKGNVYCNNETAVQELISKWIKSGMKKIAYIGGTVSLSTQQERLSGYRKALGTAGINYDEKLVIEGDFTSESAYDGVKHLDDSDVKYDALFAASLIQLQGVIKYFSEKGRLNLNVKLGTFDDHPLLDFFKWPVDSVEQPCAEIAAAAFDLLLKKINGDKVSADTIIPCNVKERAY